MCKPLKTQCKLKRKPIRKPLENHCGFSDSLVKPLEKTLGTDLEGNDGNTNGQLWKNTGKKPMETPEIQKP